MDCLPKIVAVVERWLLYPVSGGWTVVLINRENNSMITKKMFQPDIRTTAHLFCLAGFLHSLHSVSENNSFSQCHDHKQLQLASQLRSPSVSVHLLSPQMNCPLIKKHNI